jgi:hypothetical protein
MESGQSQFHDAYIDSRIVPPSIWNKLDDTTKNAMVWDGFKMPYRFRIVWSRELLDLTSIKGYYIVDAKLWNEWVPGYIRNEDGKIVGGNPSPLTGLKMFEL